MDLSRIPNRLKKYRRASGLSQSEVAKAIGMKHTTNISRWEKGLAYPSLFHLFQLSILYNTLPPHLYFEDWQTAKKSLLEIKHSPRVLADRFVDIETYIP